MRTALVVLTIAGLILPPQCVWAWNDRGHMTVAAVAYSNLSAPAKARVDDLLAKHVDFDRLKDGIPTNDPNFGLRVFAKAATWPDMIRNDPRFFDDTDPQAQPTHPPAGFPALDTRRHRPWHFIDIPFSFDATATEAAPVPNAVTKIVDFRIAISDESLPDYARAYDLCWLLHLVGDTHQPLHATTRFTQSARHGDHGGNGLKLHDPDNQEIRDLHTFWDHVLGENQAQPEFTQLATDISKEFAEGVLEISRQSDAVRIPSDSQASASVMRWAEESAAISKYFCYTIEANKTAAGLAEVTNDYRTVAVRIARHRAAIAGYRLAEILNDRLR